MVKKVFDLGTDKNPQIIDWLALTGRGKPEAKSARKKLDDENDDDDMEGPDAPPSSSDLPKAGGRTKDIYGGIISKWTNICQADANYAAVRSPRTHGTRIEKMQLKCLGLLSNDALRL